MKLSILGTQRTGKKSFNLKSEDDLGYYVECINDAGVKKYNGIIEIDWLNEGRHVYLFPKQETEFVDFSDYDKVTIKKNNTTSAVKISLSEELFSEQELRDIRDGLYIAMKWIDEISTGKGTDKILCDRLEIIHNKLQNSFH